METFFQPLEEISNGFSKAFAEEFDFDFSVNEKKINTFDEFLEALYVPFKEEKTKVFYRGERINASSRPLLPTIFRQKERLLNGNWVVNINSEFLLDFYKSLGDYFPFYNSEFSAASKNRLYELCAFSQHYIDCSPFIDFTKSLYVALSFALKGRKNFDDDIVIYTAKISDPDNYTNDIVVAECWLREYKVSLFNSPEAMLKMPAKMITPSDIKEFRETLELSAKNASPKARLIDIPNNDLMKHQKGVFLLLTDFHLVQKSYLTKNIRSDFYFTKYVINKDICPRLLELVNNEAPWYEYSCLLDVSKAAKTAINSKK